MKLHSIFDASKNETSFYCPECGKKIEVDFTSSEMISFLCQQFKVSRTYAKEMLHGMMLVKKEDNFKKQFNGRKGV